MVCPADERGARRLFRVLICALFPESDHGVQRGSGSQFRLTLLQTDNVFQKEDVAATYSPSGYWMDFGIAEAQSR